MSVQCSGQRASVYRSGRTTTTPAPGIPTCSQDGTLGGNAASLPPSRPRAQAARAASASQAFCQPPIQAPQNPGTIAVEDPACPTHDVAGDEDGASHGRCGDMLESMELLLCRHRRQHGESAVSSSASPSRGDGRGGGIRSGLAAHALPRGIWSSGGGLQRRGASPMLSKEAHLQPLGDACRKGGQQQRHPILADDFAPASSHAGRLQARTGITAARALTSLADLPTRGASLAKAGIATDVTGVAQHARGQA